MTIWRQCRVPAFCERIIAVSIPTTNEVIVLSYEGAHLLRLGAVISVERIDCYREEDLEPDSNIIQFKGEALSAIGLYGSKDAVLEFANERLLLDQESETLSVLTDGQAPFSFEYENFSGDWAAATFSRDGRFIVLACPYDFDLVVLERVPLQH